MQTFRDLGLTGRVQYKATVTSEGKPSSCWDHLPGPVPERQKLRVLFHDPLPGSGAHPCYIRLGMIQAIRWRPWRRASSRAQCGPAPQRVSPLSLSPWSPCLSGRGLEQCAAFPGMVTPPPPPRSATFLQSHVVICQLLIIC